LRRLAGLAAVLARLADERVVLVLVHKSSSSSAIVVVAGVLGWRRAEGTRKENAGLHGRREGKTIPYRRWVIINALPSEPEA